MSKPTKRKPKRGKPEKDVEAACMAWMKSQGFSMDVVEASTYDSKTGGWINQRVKSGVVDSFGNTADGLAVYVEFKAKGRLSTLRDNQRSFLVKKIAKNCFACVVDSAERLDNLYDKWLSFRKKNAKTLCKKILMDALPVKRCKREKEGKEQKENNKAPEKDFL